MKTRLMYVGLFVNCLLVTGIVWSALSQEAVAADSSAPKIVFIAGPCQHPPGTHEAAASARLLEYCVEHTKNVKPFSAQVFSEWPKEKRVLEEAATIVFTGDIFPPERMEQPAEIKAQLAKMMDRGCGIVCLHYATGLRASHVSEDGDHPLLHWLGGYFATGCKHHRSVARVLTSTMVPEDNDHPILQGWTSFTFDDEPYWNNYFGKNGFASNVTPLVYSMLPPDAPKKETIAWAVQRPDGGRGVGIVLPHYYRSWWIDDLRTLVMNSIVWTAKTDVPADGVKTTLPDMAAFEPGSVEPKPRPKRKPSR